MCKGFNISRLFLDKVVKDMVDQVVIELVDDREEYLLWVEIFWVRLTECQQEKHLWRDSNYFLGMFSLIHLLFLSYLSCFSWDKVYTLILPNAQCFCRIFSSPRRSAVNQYIGTHKYGDIWVTNWRRSNFRSHHTALCLATSEFLCMCVFSKQHIDR